MTNHTPPSVHSTAPKCSSAPRLLWSIALASLVSGLLTAQSSGPQTDVAGYSGTFSTKVPIAVPDFHGLEPKLALVYGSGGSDSGLGVGWALQGLSCIQAGRPGGGLPKYDGTDAYFLDGMELITPQAPYPLGGTHAAKIQNFARITFDQVHDWWTVVGTNGVVATYGDSTDSVFRNSPGNPGTFRWMLHTVTDCSGNTVTYHYYSPLGVDVQCYSITYNGNDLQLIPEDTGSRPDAFSYPTGLSGRPWGKVSTRLGAIQVKVSGQTARIYDLAYSLSSTTGRSVLTSVTQYDRNATLTGGTASGTSLPAMTLLYNQPSTGLAHMTTTGAPSSWSTADRTWVADFTGDGLADFATSMAGGGVFLKTSNGTTFSNSQLSLGGFNLDGHPVDQIWIGDFDGDGKGDIAARTSGTNIALFRGNGTSFATQENWATSNSWGVMSDTWAADFDGDGRTDIASRSGFNVYVHLSRNVLGTNQFVVQTWTTPSSLPWGASNLIRLGDFNGDGRTDIASVMSGAPLQVLMHLSTGSGFSSTYWNTSTSAAHFAATGYVRVGDFNGDGLTDFSTCKDYPGLNQTDLGFHFSNGANGFETYVYNQPFAFPGPAATYTGDFNGDGQADVVARFDATSTTRYFLTREKGQALQVNAVSDANSWGDATYGRVADFNGDGRADIAAKGVANSDIELQYSVGEPSDYLSSVNNGMGSTTTITYKSSRQALHNELPMGVVMFAVGQLVTTVVGGGGTNTDYTYESAKWSSAQRRFLGYGKSTASVNGGGYVTITEYSQDERTLNKPTKTTISANGFTYSETTFEYISSGAAPYWSHCSARIDDTYNGYPGRRRTRTEYGYDIYGNVMAVTEYGDWDVGGLYPGDERYTFRGYAPNTTNYVVGLPAYEIQYAGTNTSGPILAATVYYYDGATAYTTPPVRGLTTKVEKYCDLTQSWVSSSMGYDPYGNLTSQTDERGYTASIAYDGVYHVFPVSATNAKNHTTTRTWDYVLGLESSSTDPNGATTSTAYDGFGRQTSVTYPGGAVATTQYLNWNNPLTRCIRQTLPDGTANGLWTDTYLDGLGRKTKTIKEGTAVGQDIQVLTTYKFTTDLVETETLPFVSGTPKLIHCYYDWMGRPSATIYPDNASTTIEYLMDGSNKPYERHRTLNTQYQTMTETNVWYDVRGKLARIEEKLGTTSLNTYYVNDVMGRLVQVTDAQNKVSQFLYDTLSRKVASFDPDMGLWLYLHDPAGNLILQIDAKGQSITFAYDELNRMVSKTYPNATMCTWQYDAVGHGFSIGRLTTESSPSGSQDYSYELRGLTQGLHWKYGVQPHDMSFIHDAMGRLLSQVDIDGVSRNYTYDDRGNVKSVSGLVTNMTWTPSGQPDTVSYANGTSSTYTYDVNRLWLTSAEYRRGTTVLHQGGYIYDDAARVTGHTSTTHPARNRTFAYDTLSRLTSVTGPNPETFAYDSVGNMTFNSNVGTYTYNGGHAHAPDTVNGVPVSYDLNGNTLSDGSRTFTWDYDNRLSSVATAAGTTTFGYDAGGGRVTKTTGAGTETYYGSFASESGGTITKYHRLGAMLIAKDVSGTLEFFHSDQLENVLMSTDAAGNVLTSVDYLAYGAQIGTPPYPAPLTFNGQWQDASNLIYMGARYYDPVLGRFLQPDTIVPGATNPQALNRYSFCLDNPIVNKDPSGHAPVAAAVIMATIVTASSAATTLVIVTAWVGVGLTVAGYFANDPYLAAAGSILLGFAGGYIGPTTGWGGGILGATGAAATSAVSPLDAKAKVCVGWAFSTVGTLNLGQSVTAENVVSGAFSTGWRTGVKLGVDKTLAHYGIDPGELNIALTVVSFVGNALPSVGSRMTTHYFGSEGCCEGFPSEVFLKGIFNRGPQGWLFDAADIMLAYQGLPTATAYEYMFSGATSLPLVGHSLGAVDANNLAGWNIPGGGVVVDGMPMFVGANPYVRANYGHEDPVSWFGAAFLFSPFRSIYHDEGHNSIANYR